MKAVKTQDLAPIVQTIGFAELVREMVESDCTAAKRDSLVKLGGVPSVRLP